MAARGFVCTVRVTVWPRTTQRGESEPEAGTTGFHGRRTGAGPGDGVRAGAGGACVAPRVAPGVAPRVAVGLGAETGRWWTGSAPAAADRAGAAVTEAAGEGWRWVGGEAD